ncbi:MAG TPA: Clp protease N-terminal domain-containing protein, partial [Pirellulales bacterium]|nr:Clp protease N-terminal domain-containing protein [Pirellulales bacterium]
MPFRFDKLTVKAQEAVQRAQELASEAGNPQVEPLHLLAGVLSESEGIAGAVLEKMGANRAQLQQTVEAELKHLPRSSGGSPPSAGGQLMQVLEGADREATTMKDEFVSVEHLLLALAKVDTKARNVLKLNAITEPELLKALQKVRGSQRVQDQNPEGKFQALEKYGIDLVERAQQGKLDPVIGRDQEIRRV